MKHCKKLLCMVVAFALLLPQLAWASALNITATSSYVMDADTGETLYASYADLRRTPASMTKVLTSYIVHQELEKGTFTLETQVPISAHAAAISRSSSYPMSVPLTKSSYPVDTLLTLLHVPSASGACVALAEFVEGNESAFVTRMNKTAQELGLDAIYYNVHGCGPNKITARSQAILTRHFIDTYPQVLRYTCQSSVYFEGNTYTNGNKLLDGAYEGADGFKTGTYDDSGYCLSSTAVRNGRRVIAIAMNANSNATRNSDSAALLDYGFAEIAKRDASRASTAVTLTAQSAAAECFRPLTVRAALSGISYNYTADAQWYVNNEPVSGYHNASYAATNGGGSTLTYYPNGTEGDSITVSFVLTMPDGSVKRGETTVPVLQSDISFGGRLNPYAVNCYPDATIPVSAQITVDSAAETLICTAQWMLDGTPIAGYGNNKFKITNGTASSAYTWRLPADTAIGSHELSLVLAAGSPYETVLRCTVTVTDPAAVTPELSTEGTTEDDVDSQANENAEPVESSTTEAA